jgi:hypothetical protein
MSRHWWRWTSRCRTLRRRLPSGGGCSRHSTVPPVMTPDMAVARNSAAATGHPSWCRASLGHPLGPRNHNRGPCQPGRATRLLRVVTVTGSMTPAAQPVDRLPRVESADCGGRSARAPVARRAAHRRNRARHPRRADANRNGHHGVVERRNGRPLSARARQHPQGRSRPSWRAALGYAHRREKRGLTAKIAGMATSPSK